MASLHRPVERWLKLAVVMPLTYRGAFAHILISQHQVLKANAWSSKRC